jgi:small subunit ribosomal protein S6
MFLLHPELSTDDRDDAVEKFSGIITDDGGQIVNVDKWPLKKLAYKVQKQTHGYYVVIDFGAKSSTIQELTRNFRLDERVMKFITTKLDDEFNAEEAAKKYEQAQKEEEAPAEPSSESSSGEKEE